MRVALLYVPTKKQALFHASTADEALYGGAAGGGKSKAVVMEALMRCLEHPGTAAYLFRRTYRELEDTLIGEALRSIPEALGTYRAASHEFALVNGSVLRFRHCQNDRDRFRYQGAEIHWLFIDELTHFSLAVYEFLKSRLRARADLGIRPVCRCTSNPGGPGHAWVKARFVDAGEAYLPHGVEVTSPMTGESRVMTVQYIPALVTDNPHIGREYVFELEQKPRALREALLYGRWDAFEGQAFPEFRPEHVVAGFEVPEHWTRYRSFDFGYSRPFSVGWWAVDERGAVYRYREWYGGRGNEGIRLSPTQIARGIREQEAQHERGLTVMGVADPSIWDASRGMSVAELMEREGISFVKAQNARLAGKMELHERLRFGPDGKAGLYVFEGCRDWIRTVPSLCYSAERPEDVDTKAEDHAYDETRYFLMERPVRGAAKKARKAWNPLD